MSSIKIGLDFGTHQTKVCIVDNSDRRNRRYLFHRFKDLNGKDQLTIPSIVQVNADGTLSYGYTDTKLAKMALPPTPSNAPAKPKEPKYLKYNIFPEIHKPTRPQILDENPPKKENVINDFSGLMSALLNKKKSNGKTFKQQQEEAKEKYNADIELYNEQCRERLVAIEDNRRLVDNTNADLRLHYEKDLQLYEQWLSDNRKPIPTIIRYFKQTVFSTGMKWDYEIDAMLISIWYLTFVFFTLDEKYDTRNLIVSMGTSSGVNTWASNKRKATEIILTVYDLIERVFNHDMQRFLTTPLAVLKEVTRIVPYSQSAKEENAIFVFPEAIANLQPLAQRKAFSIGLNLLVDIGGGTTDISLFTAPPGKNVCVYDYQSLPFGINSINKNGTEPHFTAVSRSVWDFSNKLERYATSIHVPMHEVKKITRRRNVIFTGGGSANNKLIRPYHGFSEIIRFRERFFNLMPTNNIEQDVKDEIHVLSTALGLAMAPEDDSSIPMHTYIQLFSNVEKAYSSRGSKNGGDKYIHGLSDY